jgi:betaine-homocysteine S-methyltransferase
MAIKAKPKSRAKSKSQARVRSKGKPRTAPRVTAAAAHAAPARANARDLLGRLSTDGVICAEGYVFELERRGYLQAGAFVPEVLFDHPEVVEQLHLDFVHAGSDVTQALTYYVHREKLRVIGREKDLVPMNRAALKIAKSVARRTGTLFAGDLCNTNIYDPADPASLREIERIFAEQVGWAADAGVDYFVAETFSWGAEALLALAAIRKYSKVPAVMTMAMHREDVTREGWTAADVLPVPYRTNPAQPSFMSLTDPCCGNQRAFPVGLDPFVCTRQEIFDFGKEAFALGIRYLGVCCGAGPHHIRALAESLGRRPPASRYSVDMSRHAFFGNTERIKKIQTDYRAKL